MYLGVVMNTIAQTGDVIAPIAVLILGLLAIFILIMAVLMPIYVYMIYRQGVKNQRMLDGFMDGFNKVLLSLHHIQGNTAYKSNKSKDDLPL